MSLDPRFKVEMLTALREILKEKVVVDIQDVIDETHDLIISNYNGILNINAFTGTGQAA
ncbi:hypothetical protein VKS41_003467 [Umbelopsis sp. WA50703]